MIDVGNINGKYVIRILMVNKDTRSPWCEIGTMSEFLSFLKLTGRKEAIYETEHGKPAAFVALRTAYHTMMASSRKAK